jgi:hypothetical protein
LVDLSENYKTIRDELSPESAGTRLINSPEQQQFPGRSRPFLEELENGT